MIAGIDLGTSALKLLLIHKNGIAFRSTVSYKEDGIKGWLQALKEAFSLVPASQITAIGLSSQVGTYVYDTDKVLSWQAPAGRDELHAALKTFPEKVFLEEISMMHPQILSYPIPRIGHIQKICGNPGRICQPKEILTEFLTGKRISDPFSWRGLAHQEKGCYSPVLLSYLGITEEMLPPLASPFSVCGRVTEEAALSTGLSKGIPVYTGCNDFYASLLGMGISRPGDAFDITGTSEHVGVITEEGTPKTSLVSSPFFDAHVHYGVTASSGASLSFGIKNLDLKALPVDYEPSPDAPIFLPYLNGERAPIFDEKARGVFFGLKGDTDKQAMAFSILEGVAFSTCHIYETIGASGCKRLITSGGASANPLLNQLKADLFGIPVVPLSEPDASALGAAMAAAVGAGFFPDLQNAASVLCGYGQAVMPKSRPHLFKRFEFYKELYRTLKPCYSSFERLSL